jgi:hypothetical protein
LGYVSDRYIAIAKTNLLENELDEDLNLKYETNEDRIWKPCSFIRSENMPKYEEFYKIKGDT